MLAYMLYDYAYIKSKTSDDFFFLTTLQLIKPRL